MFKSLENGDEHAIWFKDFMESLVEKNEKLMVNDEKPKI